MCFITLVYIFSSELYVPLIVKYLKRVLCLNAKIIYKYIVIKILFRVIFIEYYWNNYKYKLKISSNNNNLLYNFQYYKNRILIILYIILVKGIFPVFSN